MTRTLTADNLDQIVFEHFEKEIKTFREDKIQPNQYQNTDWIKTLEGATEDLKMRLATDTEPLVVHSTDWILKTLDIDPNCDPHIANRLTNAINTISVLWYELTTLRSKGEIDQVEDKINEHHEKLKKRANKEQPPPTQIIQQVVQPEVNNSVNSATILEVIDEFLRAETITKGKKAPSATTLEDYRKKLLHFNKLLDNKAFKTINKQDVINCKDWTYNLPKNLTKIGWKATHPSEIAVIKDPNHNHPTISPNTASDYLSQLKKLLKFGYANNYHQEDAVNWLKFNYTKTPENEREPFTPDELKAIFSGHIYQSTWKEKHQKPHRFWVPLLGAFTGARLNELCSLYLKDFEYDDTTGYWFISITDDTEDKKVKTKSSRRLIPIHKTLENAGLIRFMQSLQKKNFERLFSELSHREKEGYSKQVSRWFCALEKSKSGTYKGYLAKVGVKTESTTPNTKNFHCFRHTFINNLKNNPDVEILKVADLVGHEPNLLQTQQYGGTQLSKTIKVRTLEQLDYKVDFSHISWK